MKNESRSDVNMRIANINKNTNISMVRSFFMSRIINFNTEPKQEENSIMEIHKENWNITFSRRVSENIQQSINSLLIADNARELPQYQARS